MQTLIELLQRFSSLGEREALRYTNGYRTWRYTYADLQARASGFAAFLKQQGFTTGEKVLLWGENRPEWLTVFWGCIARGVIVVPIDFQSSPEFVLRVQERVQARLAVVGDAPASQLVARAAQLPIPKLSLSDIAALPSAAGLDPVALGGDDVVEILFTSGTTGTPKGVIHRHRNICANLAPIAREMERYRHWARPFQPLRLMVMLPLSHVFGQGAGLFAPLLLGGAAVFSDEYRTRSIIETIRAERVSVLVAVPRFLNNLSHEIERRFAPADHPLRFSGLVGAAESWWRYRDIHRHFGLKFWCFLVGGAQLDTGLEHFWKRLGFVIVQGYGLTESGLVVSLNHPFRARSGSIGEPIEGQQIKLAPDGEILVRGASVVNDYLGGDETTSTYVTDGWLHTGDIGEQDAEGRLYLRGRKKEMIVTPEGLNVFPGDIEAVLNAQPEIQESVVVGVENNGEEQIHAVLITDPGADLSAVVRRVNAQLEPHQRIRSWSRRHADDLPRTHSTHKAKRQEVARQVAAQQHGASPAARPAAAAGTLTAALMELTGRGETELSSETHLDDDLAISSLQRMELLARLESDLGVDLSEEEFARARTAGDLQALLEADQRTIAVPPANRLGTRNESGQAAPPKNRATEPSSHALAPRWSRLLPIRWGRRVIVDCLLLPLMKQMIRLRFRGLENLDTIKPPFILIANHTSHFDTACILASLPFRLRTRLAPAMSQDYFWAYLDRGPESWRERCKLGLQFYLAVGLFNAYPLPQKMGGTRRALRYTGELVDHGYCPLVFPEGERSRTGGLQPFKPGIGLLVEKLRVPVVPIWIQGAYEVASVQREWPRPGNVELRFGRPIEFRAGESGERITARLEQAVRSLGEVPGAEGFGAPG